MAQSGRLVQWNDERGFGFIEGGDGQRHFVHISAIGRIATRPRIGDRVNFVPERGADGRLQARTVSILGANPSATPEARRRGMTPSPARFDWRLVGAALVVILLLTGLALGRVPWELATGYAAMGLVSFNAYWMDKKYAETGQWRTSEVTLLGIDLCLGLAGGLLGQAAFRHKTRKRDYAAASGLILAVHLLWLGGFVAGLIDASEFAGWARSVFSLAA